MGSTLLILRGLAAAAFAVGFALWIGDRTVVGHETNASKSITDMAPDIATRIDRSADPFNPEQLRIAFEEIKGLELGSKDEPEKYKVHRKMVTLLWLKTYRVAGSQIDPTYDPNRDLPVINVTILDDVFAGRDVPEWVKTSPRRRDPKFIREQNQIRTDRSNAQVDARLLLAITSERVFKFVRRSFTNDDRQEFDDMLAKELGNTKLRGEFEQGLDAVYNRYKVDDKMRAIPARVNRTP
jgi:hypothetical protein